MPVEPIAGIELPPITDYRHPSYQPEREIYTPSSTLDIEIPKREPLVPRKPFDDI